MSGIDAGTISELTSVQDCTENYLSPNPHENEVEDAVVESQAP